MSDYHTLRSELTGAAANDYMNTIGINGVNDELARLNKLRRGIIKTIMIPNRTKMDEYLIARVDYLNSQAPLVNTSSSTSVRQWEWRTQLTVTSGPISSRATGTLQLCADEVYGNYDDRYSTIANWTIEKWNKVSKRAPRSRYYYLSASYAGDTEVYSDISTTTISEAGLAGKYTVSDLTQAADDFYIGMGWIHATNDYNLAGHPHYSQYASHGIDYLINASNTGFDALDSRKQHFTNLTSLCGRYYTI